MFIIASMQMFRVLHGPAVGQDSNGFPTLASMQMFRVLHGPAVVQDSNGFPTLASKFRGGSLTQRKR